jgi:MFS transporter, DHA1 family, tetracycline resistance protein
VTDASPAPAARQAGMGFIMVTVLLDMVSFGMVIPVLPMLVLQLEGGDTAKAAAIAGIFGAAWAAMQFLFSPILGALSDRYGRRPVLLLSMAGMGIDKVFMALAPTLPILFIGRMISGASAASFSTAAAYVSDVTPPQERAKNFAYLQAAFSAGFILGPVLGGFLGSPQFAAMVGVTPEEALRIPFWVAAGLCLINAAWGYFVLPESLPAEKRAPFRWVRANPLGSLALLSSTPVLLGLAGVHFLNQLAFGALPSSFALYAHHRFGWDSAAVGLCLGLVGVMGILVGTLVTARFVKAYGERAAILMGLACVTIAFTIYGAAPVAAVFLCGVPFGALGNLYAPGAQALMTQRVDPTQQGQLQGALASIMGLTGMIAPLLFTGALSYGIAPGGPNLPGLAFFIAACITAAAFIAAWFVTAKLPRAAAPLERAG